VESVALLYSLPEPSGQPSGALIAEAPVTASNDFDLFPVPAGTYRLEIQRGDQMIVVSPLTVPG
jgi:hypothetical protein